MIKESERAKVKDAFDSGLVIRHRFKSGLHWMPCFSPTWDWANFDYEVDPCQLIAQS